MSVSLADSSGTLRPMLRLAAPVFIEQSLTMLVGLSDQLLTGHLFDQEHLAAINLMMYLLWLSTSLFVVVAIGATAMTARFIGARDSAAALHVTNQAMLMGTLLSLAFTIAAWLGRSSIVAAMQLDGHTAELAVVYLTYIIPSLPAIMIGTVGAACLRGAGDMVTGLLVMTLVNIVNVVVSWSLALGLGPLPALGWNALGIGTASGYFAGGTSMLIVLLVGRSGLRLHRHLLLPNIELLRRLLRIGVPGGADVFAIIGCQLWFVAIINQMGDLAAAAHGVAIRIESLAYLPVTAFQVAAATMAGQFLGARDYRRASRSVITACTAGIGFMLVAATILYLGASQFTQLFLAADRVETSHVAAQLLRIVAFALPALALAMILAGALRGAGDTRWPLVFSLVGNLGVRVPGAYLLTQYYDFGVQGAWYAMVGDILVRATLVSYRFLHGGWKRVDV